MSEATRLVREDAYEEMGSSYQCVQVEALDAALREHGVSDEAVRRKVCESFLLAMGTFHDQCWLKATPGGEPLYPLLCFAGRFPDADLPAGELGTVYAPSALFSFYEYAFGNVDLYFGGDPAAKVETGTVG